MCLVSTSTEMCLKIYCGAVVLQLLWCVFARGLRRNCQLLLFSATYDDQVMRFAESIVHDAIIIKLRREQQSLDNIKQYYIECNSLEDKFSALSNIYGSISIGQSMIFCHVSNSCTEFLARDSIYAIARSLPTPVRLSICPSLCLSVPLSVTRVDQSKTVHDRITQSSPQCSPMTLVSSCGTAP